MLLFMKTITSSFQNFQNSFLLQNEINMKTTEFSRDIQYFPFLKNTKDTLKKRVKKREKTMQIQTE